WHERDPEGSSLNYAKCRAATAAHNRERALLRRVRGWLPSRWYPVDHAARVIHNTPSKNPGAVYGADFDLGMSGRSFGSLLGFPGVPTVAACFLAVLAAAGALSLPEVLDSAEAMRRLRRWAPFRPTAHTWYTFRKRLPGWVLRLAGRRGRGGYRYRISASA